MSEILNLEKRHGLDVSNARLMSSNKKSSEKEMMRKDFMKKDIATMERGVCRERSTIELLMEQNM